MCNRVALALPQIVRKDGQNNRPGGVTMLATFRNATIGAAGCALAIGAAPAAWAGVMTYDTVAAFDAATTGLTAYAIPAPAGGARPDVRLR
jgi:hypothetical protein